jgi:hypothetical protein
MEYLPNRQISGESASPSNDEGTESAEVTTSEYLPQS